MSLKRRRAINIDTAMIDALKAEANSRGLKSHTTLAIAILLGEQAPLPPMEERSTKTLGVSMRESIWLSVRHRAKFTTTPVLHAMSRMLTGQDPHLTPEEISKGKEVAAKRESERAKEPQPPKQKRKRPSTEVVKREPSPPSPIDEEAEDEEERKARQAKLPKGSLLDPPKKPKQSGSDGLNLEEEYLGGIYSL